MTDVTTAAGRASDPDYLPSWLTSNSQGGAPVAGYIVDPSQKVNRQQRRLPRDRPVKVPCGKESGFRRMGAGIARPL
jgi:hypothetical protein